MLCHLATSKRKKGSTHPVVLLVVTVKSIFIIFCFVQLGLLQQSCATKSIQYIEVCKAQR